MSTEPPFESNENQQLVFKGVFYGNFFLSISRNFLYSVEIIYGKSRITVHAATATDCGSMDFAQAIFDGYTQPLLLDDKNLLFRIGLIKN